MGVGGRCAVNKGMGRRHVFLGISCRWVDGRGRGELCGVGAVNIGEATGMSSWASPAVLYAWWGGLVVWVP